MEIVILTALGVGGATIGGALIGFAFKNISHKFTDIILGFAAGVMLCAAVLGLIIPALEYGSENGSVYAVLITFAGIMCGAVVLNLIDGLTPHLHKLGGVDNEQHPQGNDKVNGVLLFVLAIAIHNIPEGIAAGVGFGLGNDAAAMTIALGIALQNVPEGMVIIGPMLSAGISRWRTLLIACLTGVVEVLGTFVGYFAVTVSAAILPFTLAFAGGTMLYVISDEMIPETHADGSERGATYALLLGFSLMLIMDFLI